LTTSPKNPSHKSVERFENEGGTTRAGELTRKEKTSTEGAKCYSTPNRDHQPAHTGIEPIVQDATPQS